MERALDAADGEWESAPAVRECDAELREPIEHAAEDHRTDRQRCLGRHADEPRQPIIRHALLAEHVPRMNEDRRAELLRRAPNWLKRRIVQIYGVDATRVRVCIDMRTDLRPAQTQFTHASLQLARRQIRILQRYRSQTRESFRMTANNFGDVIV